MISPLNSVITSTDVNVINQQIILREKLLTNAVSVYSGIPIATEVALLKEKVYSLTKSMYRV